MNLLLCYTTMLRFSYVEIYFHVWHGAIIVWVCCLSYSKSDLNHVTVSIEVCMFNQQYEDGASVPEIGNDDVLYEVLGM